ncbi:MAG: NAD-dependent epimerase/dehydratase family protein [Myxococcales bacterium]
MKILVTGGAGFIGSHVADAALAAGHEVLVVDDLSTGRRENLPKQARFVELDIRKGEQLADVVADFKPHMVSHQAAQTSVSISTREPIRDAEINVLGTINLLNACVAQGVERVVFASTGGAIYGEVPEGERRKETDRPIPLSPYACSKYAVEAYLGFYRQEYGLKSTVLRYANVYGPRQDPHGEAGVVAIFAQRLIAKQPIQINARRKEGDDGCVRDYVFVEDVVRANLGAIDGTIADPIVNVCTGEATTTRALALELQRLLGTQVELRAGARRAGDVERSVLDPTRFLATVGRVATLDEGLKKTAAWFAAR